MFPNSLVFGLTVRPSRRAFSLVELLVVLAIVSLLAAMLFPVFLSVRGKARQSVCLSNLCQIGMGLSQYMQDNDSRYPYAIDPIDLIIRDNWSRDFPQYMADMPRLPMVHHVLQPYLKSQQLFACPSDIGFVVPDYPLFLSEVNALPTSFQKLGTSYFYRSELAARHAGDFTVEFPTRINVFFEAVGSWHGSLDALGAPTGRYSTLFADGHAASATQAQVIEMWQMPLNGSLTPPT